MKDLLESRFFQRLQKAIASESAGSGAHGPLQVFSGSIEQIVKIAEKISARVVSVLPQFTLHDENHLWNVLRLMEELAGEEMIEKMSPLECGIAILAAFTHDLGMALSAEELEAMTDPSKDDSSAHATAAAAAWRSYFDGHPLAERIREARAITAAESRALTEDEASHLNRALGQIRSDYVRESHAREEGVANRNRIEDWLLRIEASLKLSLHYDGTDLSSFIALLAMSHGQSIFWLGERFTRRPKPLLEREELVRAHRIKGQEVNWAFLSWLLRLADIIDFDASRTPVVLFDHIGIRDATSRIEWQKHLSISEPPRFGQGTDRSTLLYVCEVCPHSRIEKAIKDMIGWINGELSNVRGELQRHPPTRGLTLHLPSHAEVDIQSRKDGYLYQDLEFQLRREAILELLMGESLYGDRSLALRELVQNALDAVDLRNKLWNKLPAATRKATDMPEPHEPWDGDEPGVWVTWGQEEGRNFIRVRDSGVGMTLGAIRRFLTQIGKSYYKSDTYHRERELMREHGLICTPISQFGIGFLSVFMLADKVTIRTRPVGAKDEFPEDRRTEAEKEAKRFPLRAEIDGPHGLIGIYPEDNFSSPGTEVTLWLKREHAFVSWDRGETLGWLRNSLYNDRDEKAREAVRNYEHSSLKLVNPAFEIGKYAIWPLYPITLHPCHYTTGKSEHHLVIDDRFHFDHLIPLDQEEFERKTIEWKMTSYSAEPVRWRLIDWCDNGPQGTGSRVRLTVPCTEGSSHNIATAEFSLLAASLNSEGDLGDLYTLVHPQLECLSGRHRILINGMRVPDVGAIWESLHVALGLGSCLWLDFRQQAAPRLTADRSKTTQAQPSGTISAIDAIQHQWLLDLQALPQVRPARFEVALHLPTRRPESLRTDTSAILFSRPLWKTAQLLAHASVTGSADNRPQQIWAWDKCRDPDLAKVGLIGMELPRHLGGEGTWSEVLTDRILDLSEAATTLRRISRNLMRNPMRERFRNLRNALDFSDHDEIDPVEFTDEELPLCWAAAMCCSHLSETLSELLSQSFEPTASNRHGNLSEYNLRGPLCFEHRSNVEEYPSWLMPYDLVLPFTNRPMGAMKGLCPLWIEIRGIRALFTSAFFFGDEVTQRWNTNRELLSEALPIKTILAFFPAPELWTHKFASASEAQWAEGSASALWDLTNGTVRFADGIHTVESIRSVGLPLDDWFLRSMLPTWNPAYGFEILQPPT